MRNKLHLLKKLTMKLPFTMSPKLMGVTISLMAVVMIPLSVLAWGPQRAMFTMNNPATYPTFNSISDNPKYGDETNFMRVRDIAANENYGDNESLVAGKKYEVMVLFHNNASSSFNANGSGIAHGAYTRAEIPALVKAGSADTPAQAFVNATNTNPTSVYDSIHFTNKTAGDMALRYVPGSTVIHSFGAVNGQKLPDTILSSTGVKLGYSALDGNIPGCNDYSGYVTFTVTADQSALSFIKKVRVDGTTGWNKTTQAKTGDTVDYLLDYTNTGTVQQKNVVFKDQLPTGLTYVAGSSKLITDTAPDGETTNDSINAGGIDVGTYNPSAGSYLTFKAKVTSTACETLTNTAYIETDNGWTSDTADVQVSASGCTPPPAALPQTGPVEIVSGLIGLAAITFGIVYYFRSRKDLESALRDAQSTPMSHHKVERVEHHSEDKILKDK